MVGLVWVQIWNKTLASGGDVPPQEGRLEENLWDVFDHGRIPVSRTILLQILLPLHDTSIHYPHTNLSSPYISPQLLFQILFLLIRLRLVAESKDSKLLLPKLQERNEKAVSVPSIICIRRCTLVFDSHAYKGQHNPLIHRRNQT